MCVQRVSDRDCRLVWKLHRKRPIQLQLRRLIQALIRINQRSIRAVKIRGAAPGISILVMGVRHARREHMRRDMAITSAISALRRIRRPEPVQTSRVAVTCSAERVSSSIVIISIQRVSSITVCVKRVMAVRISPMAVPFSVKHALPVIRPRQVPDTVTYQPVRVITLY